MADINDILGNERVKEHFIAAVHHKKISHAYIIEGDKGSGKKMLAAAFSKILQCETRQKTEEERACNQCESCIQMENKDHPDVIWVSHEKAGVISVGEIREQVVNTVDIMPYKGPYKIYIIDEAEKMNRMVKKLLTLNQLEFGNDAIVMERFDITELIRGVTASNAIILEQKGAILEFDEQPLFVWADEFKIEEVITNYLSNAINHLEGENRIKISYKCKQDVVRVSVFNTGKPIPEEDIDNIWIKFYKVDKARTRAYGGSGIGLSIVKAIMDSMHQQCGVINHEDGVEFWIELDTSNRDDNEEECEITIA